jgi:predicted AlkP superfamily pyrophosphatase or phosphodiesterase
MKYSFLIFCLFFSLNVLGKGKKTVLYWLSIDGMKYDYLHKTDSPFLKDLVTKSVFSKKLRPSYPSITFPSHTTKATGVKVAEHGIPLNFFYDSLTDKFHSYPGDSGLLGAEPIWQTVKRGGLRSAVIDWPLSYAQTSEFKSDYFENEYNKNFTDEQRVEHALKIWDRDLESGNQYNLFMAYLSEVDSAGHEYGPLDPKVYERVERTDKLIGIITEKIKNLAEKHKDYDYYFLITSDHGMEEVKYGVNLELLLDFSDKINYKLAASGPIGHLFFSKTEMSQKNKTFRLLANRLKDYPFVKMYEKNKLPKRWGYNHQTRVGDLVFVLDKEYCFVRNSPSVVSKISDIGGPRGMHGFDALKNPEMNGILIFWKYPQHPRRREVKHSIETLHLHSTVSKILGVSPSPQASSKVISELLP